MLTSGLDLLAGDLEACRVDLLRVGAHLQLAARRSESPPPPPPPAPAPGGARLCVGKLRSRCRVGGWSEGWIRG